MRQQFLVFLLSFPHLLQAMLIGNPAEPSLEKQGIIASSGSWISLRLAFLEDFVYHQRFKDEFNINGCASTKTFAKLSTNAGMATLNFEERLDLYGIFGSSCLSLNQEMKSKQQFSWGFGGKLLLFEMHNLSFGLDIKYFAANQKPLCFLCEGLAFNLVDEFQFKYSETQFALGACLRYTYIAPYVHATYLIAKIEPEPIIALVRWPLEETILVDAVCKSIVAQRRWGLAVGATLLSDSKASLSVESRMFNQNAIDINLDVRF
ncbi:MAG TPA: hypothetical protein VLE95_06925 [Chlamydiales bacterium]|nr:hypothetical protein [Chlamydiales bacterium]